MKTMTSKKLLAASLEELGFSYLTGTNKIQLFNKDFYIDLDILGIQLKPEWPKVTQENLCKFYLKFKEWPKGTVKGCSVNKDYVQEDILVNESFIGDCLGKPTQYYRIRESGNTHFLECTITDERWPQIAEGGYDAQL